MAEIKTLCYQESRSTLISACEFEDCLVTLQKSIHRCEDNVTMAHLRAFHRTGIVRVLANNSNDDHRKFSRDVVFISVRKFRALSRINRKLINQPWNFRSAKTQFSMDSNVLQGLLCTERQKSLSLRVFWRANAILREMRCLGFVNRCNLK